MTNFLVQHNQPLSIADDLGPLFRIIFTDSQIAKAYASGRTKATCIMQLLHTLQVSIVIPIVKMQFPFTFFIALLVEANVKCYVFCFFLCIFNYLKFITWQWCKLFSLEDCIQCINDLHRQSPQFMD